MKSSQKLGKRSATGVRTPDLPRAPEGRNSIGIQDAFLENPNEILGNSRWIQDLTFGDLSWSIRLIWVDMKGFWLVQKKLVCCYYVCTNITHQNCPLSDLCQIPHKVPKFTLLLRRFSVYLILPLCLSLLGCWVLPILICKTSPSGQRIIYNWKFNWNSKFQSMGKRRLDAWTQTAHS